MDPFENLTKLQDCSGGVLQRESGAHVPEAPPSPGGECLLEQQRNGPLRRGTALVITSPASSDVDGPSSRWWHTGSEPRLACAPSLCFTSFSLDESKDLKMKSHEPPDPDPTPPHPTQQAVPLHPFGLERAFLSGSGFGTPLW